MVWACELTDNRLTRKGSCSVMSNSMNIQNKALYTNLTKGRRIKVSYFKVWKVLLGLWKLTGSWIHTSGAEVNLFPIRKFPQWGRKSGGRGVGKVGGGHWQLYFWRLCLTFSSFKCLFVWLLIYFKSKVIFILLWWTINPFRTIISSTTIPLIQV